MLRRSLIASLTLASALVLVVACTGGPGSLGTFGDDGLEGVQEQQTGSSSGRPDPPPSTSSGTTSSSTSSTSSSSSGATSSTSSSGSVGVDTGAPFACGTTTCQATQYCVKPCCTKLCFAAEDAGSCPSGYTYGFCAADAANGCVQISCTPPSPYCTTTSIPSNCTRENLTTRDYVCTCN